MTLEYDMVDANRVCQGIQKVRVEPATRSAVATWFHRKKIAELLIIAFTFRIGLQMGTRTGLRAICSWQSQTKQNKQHTAVSCWSPASWNSCRDTVALFLVTFAISSYFWRVSLITGLLITGLDWTGLDWNPKICFYAQRYAIKK